MFGGYYSQADPTPPPATGDDLFPRLAAYNIGERSQHQEPQTSILASLHFFWMNPQQSRGASFVQQTRDTITNVHALNDAAGQDRTQIYIYTDLQEASFTGGLSVKLLSETGPPGAINNNGSPTANNNWFAVDEDGEYTGTGFFGAPGTGDLVHTNITTNVTPDAFGKQYPQWYAEDHVIPISLAPHNSAGVVVGVGIDVMDHRPRENGQDLDGDGNNDDARSNENTVRAQYREGHALYIQALQGTYPSMPVVINGVTHSAESTSLDPDDWGPGGGVTWSHYDNLYDGALVEGQTQQVGRSPLSGVWADGTVNSSFGSRRRAQNAILFHERHAINKKHNMNQYEMALTNVNSTNPSVPNGDCTSAVMGVARWGLLNTLMCNAYFYVTDDDATQYDRVIQLDECGTVNQSTTGLTRLFLGSPTDDSELDLLIANPGVSPVWIGSDNNGIMRRRFTNTTTGRSWWVIVNTSLTSDIVIPVVVGAGAGEIESGDLRMIPGEQDPDHNQHTSPGSGIGMTITSDLTVPKINGFILEDIS